MSTIVPLHVHSARRLPDPVFRNAEEHIFWVNVLDYPPSVPLTDRTNPREQNLNRAVYRDARASLLNQDGVVNSFHVLNRGVVLVADSVRPIPNAQDLYELSFVDDTHGVADGGHTSKMIWENQDNIRAMVGDGDEITQFLRVSVLVGYPDHVIPDIIEARNSSNAVQEFTLLSFGGEFDWIESALAGTGYASHIAFRQNAEGVIDVRDVLMLAEAINTKLYPNRGGSHPVRSYSSKQAVLNAFAADESRYTWLGPILPDLLVLYDMISYEGADRFYTFRGRRGGARFIEDRVRGLYEFPFISKTSQSRTMRGAVMPVLAAFRWFIKENPVTKKAEWDGGFGAVVAAWQEFGGELLAEVHENLDRRDINSLAKDSAQWSSLHSKLVGLKAMSALEA